MEKTVGQKPIPGGKIVSVVRLETKTVVERKGLRLEGRRKKTPGDPKVSRVCVLSSIRIES